MATGGKNLTGTVTGSKYLTGTATGSVYLFCLLLSMVSTDGLQLK